jgi:frataxin-like iron-binding protein CyaY
MKKGSVVVVKVFMFSMIDFEIIAKKFLEDLYEELEKNEDFETDLTDDGVLTISAPNGEYVINKHFASKQIWFSSPVSRLKYFNYIDGNFYEKTEKTLTLKDAIFKDLSKI